MVMNKKEQAEMQSLRNELAISQAFRRTEKVERDLMPPGIDSKFDSFVNGWDFNSYSFEVYEAWSSCIYHGSGHRIRGDERRNSTSQKPCALFSTKLLALKALRNMVEHEISVKLAKIDALIKEECGNG